MQHNRALPDMIEARLDDTRLAIFLFHGVISKQTHTVRNYTGKHIEVELFTRCMERLAQVGCPLSMDEVLRHCETQASFPKKAFAITFDDGFENNISVASPILEKLDIPATIYVTTDFIEKNGMSWIDRIEYAVENAADQTLKVFWSEKSFTLSDSKSRIFFLRAVREFVKKSAECNADDFADDLCSRLGVLEKEVSPDPLDQKMTWEQVQVAAKSRLLTIGGHSHTHAILSFLSPEKLADELDTSLQLLRQKAGVGPTHYSYPEGLAHCYSDEVIQALQQRGVRICPTAIDGINSPKTGPFQLRRIMVA